jgi:hypothetical protein
LGGGGAGDGGGGVGWGITGRGGGGRVPWGVSDSGVRVAGRRAGGGETRAVRRQRGRHPALLRRPSSTQAALVGQCTRALLHPTACPAAPHCVPRCIPLRVQRQQTPTPTLRTLSLPPAASSNWSPGATAAVPTAEAGRAAGVLLWRPAQCECGSRWGRPLRRRPRRMPCSAH